MKCVDIKTGDGKTLFTLHIYDLEVPANGNKANQTPNGNGTKPDEPMTDAQKRYLYRILAESGLEGEAATRELKKHFGTETLKEVTKAEASELIKQLLQEVKT